MEPTRERRCLIIADGFFEPHYDKPNGPAVPYYYYLEDRKLLTFAGIYNTYDINYWSASMVTGEANEFLAKVHNKVKRMPLVIASQLKGDWLNLELTIMG